MSPKMTTKINVYINAIKPLSWPKIFFPCLFGQALGWEGSLAGLLLGTTLCFFDVIAIVLLNDWGDQGVDHVKRSLFPDGGGPKTIFDGHLSPRTVFLGGLFAALCLLGICVWGAIIYSRIHLLWFGPLMLAFYQAYTFYPLKLNYRGGGEILEAIGVGFCIPWVNAYCQSGVLWRGDFVWCVFAFLPLALASAFASGLSDEESDRIGGKKTFVTILGNPLAKTLIGGLTITQVVFWGIGFLQEPRVDVSWLVFASLVLCFLLFKLKKLQVIAKTRAFQGIRDYKSLLHRGIWAVELILIIGVIGI